MSDTTTAELPVAEIILSRGETGLGFNIRGGVDNPHIPGDTGVFVTKVRENGAAFTDGRLKEGDKILAINGKSLNGVTHEEAVQCFTKAKDTVIIEVQHGAQAHILRRKMKEKEDVERANENGPNSSSSSYTLLYCGLGVVLIVGGFFAFKKFRR